MVANSISLTGKYPLLYRVVEFSRRPISHFAQQIRIPTDQTQISSFRGYSSCSFNAYTLNCGHGPVFKNLGSSKIGFGELVFDRVHVSAVSGGGSGGTGGGFGGSGDGNSGGGSEGSSDGNNWSFLSWYLALLAKYPVATKAVTSALLTLIGDLICQVVASDFHRSSAITGPEKDIFVYSAGAGIGGAHIAFLWSAISSAAVIVVLYSYLNKLVTIPGASGAFLRLIIDQFLFSPIFIGVFLSTLVSLEGRPSEVLPKLQQEWFSTVVANWQLWIPFQFLNFRFVPPQLQVLAANFIALVWNVILSFKAHKEVLHK